MNTTGVPSFNKLIEGLFLTLLTLLTIHFSSLCANSALTIVSTPTLANESKKQNKKKQADITLDPESIGCIC